MATRTRQGGGSGPGSAVVEFPVSRCDTPRLSEADLAHIWEGQRFPREALRTVDGVLLRTVYRGRRTGGAGPDYRDAIIAAPGELLQGDVELHVRSSDFRRHGHHLDPAYDRLALHLVFLHDGEGGTELASGRRVPVVALADWAEGRAAEIRAWLERPAAWEEPCRSAVPRLGAEAAGAALDRLGDIRFRAKTAAFSRRLRETGTDQALWEGIMETLGYGGRREILRSLALRAPWAVLAAAMKRQRGRSRSMVAEALLREGLAGLEQEAGNRELVYRGAGEQDAPTVPRSHAPTTGGRPGNGVEARLRGAAALAARFSAGGPWQALRPAVEGGRTGPLLALLTVAGGIGRGRAIETAANAVLPCAAAAGLEAQAEALYRRLPLPARYGAVRHLYTALGDPVAVDTRRQQGMLYLLREYCTRGGCGRCVLS